MLSQNTIWELW